MIEYYINYISHKVPNFVNIDFKGFTAATDSPGDH